MIYQPNPFYSFKFILFADDSTLSTLFVEKNSLEFTLTLNNELNNVNKSNRTKQNMIFSYRKQLDLTNIKIGSAATEEILGNNF